MKKLSIVLIMMMIILTGCSGKKLTPAEKPEEIKTETETETVIATDDTAEDIYGT